MQNAKLENQKKEKEKEVKQTEVGVKKPKKIALVLVIVGAIGFFSLLVFGFLGYLLVSGLLGGVGVRNCRALTPLFLSQLEGATMIKPIYGEKCDLGKDNFILRLAYQDELVAAQAAFGLRIAAPAVERKEDFIRLGSDAAAFYSYQNKVYMVVLTSIGFGGEVPKILKKITPEIALSGFSIPNVSASDFDSYRDKNLEKIKAEASLPTSAPTPTSEPAWMKNAIRYDYGNKATPTPTVVLEKQATDTDSEEEEILKAAKFYVEQNSVPGLKFTVSLRKQVGEYALVDVTPEPGTADPTGVILQKIGGLWIGVDMGTMFPEWEQRVPGLFN